MKVFPFDFGFKTPTEQKPDDRLQTSSSLGLNLSANNTINEELSSVTNKIRRTNKKYTDEITKYKEIAAFNKKLSASYMQNLQAMVDVSKLLEQYAHIFYVLREETEKLEKALGMDFNIQDFQYLENMTKDKMEELNRNFFKETETLKKIYEKYGKASELVALNNAQSMVASTTVNASTTFKKLVDLDVESKRTAQQETLLRQGGKSKKAAPRNKAKGVKK